MSRDNAHPALHTPPFMDGTWGKDHQHFVPEGWEDFDRGICPCGEVVRWVVPENSDPEDEALVGKGVIGYWVPDRQMRVLVVTTREAKAITDMLDLDSDDGSGESDVPTTRDMVYRQLELQNEIVEYEATDD